MLNKSKRKNFKNIKSLPLKDTAGINSELCPELTNIFIKVKNWKTKQNLIAQKWVGLKSKPVPIKYERKEPKDY